MARPNDQEFHFCIGVMVRLDTLTHSRHSQALDPEAVVAVTTASDRFQADQPVSKDTAQQKNTIHASPNLAAHDDLSRQVYCILGLAIDALEIPEAVSRIEAAAEGTAPFLISTANVNFLVSSQCDPQFRESLLLSDLCTADGMPLVWIARLLGVPIRQRVAGSDVFAVLKSAPCSAQPIRLFLLGGMKGLAASVAEALNQARGRLRCVGSLYPGFGTVEDMSTDDVIKQINSSGANFLVLSLGASKGHRWLMHNHSRLRVPVRTHFGAVLNFEAGTVKRAPPLWARLGFEWLWRIKEEPHLFTRYGHDGGMLLRLLLTRVLPLAIWARRRRSNADRGGFAIEKTSNDGSLTLAIHGDATERHVGEAATTFRSAISEDQNVKVDLNGTKFLDPRFFGLLLMLRKQLNARAKRLEFTGVSQRIGRLFRLNGVDFLLQTGQ